MSELSLRVPGADPSVSARTSTPVTGPGGGLEGRDRRVPAERMLLLLHGVTDGGEELRALASGTLRFEDEAA